MNEELMLAALNRVLDADDVQEVMDLYTLLLDTYEDGFRDGTLYTPLVRVDAQPSDRGYDQQLEFEF